MSNWWLCINLFYFVLFECYNNLTNSTYFASTALDESIENINGPIISNLIGAVKFELGALNYKFSHLQFWLHMLQHFCSTLYVSLGVKCDILIRNREICFYFKQKFSFTNFRELIQKKGFNLEHVIIKYSSTLWRRKIRNSCNHKVKCKDTFCFTKIFLPLSIFYSDYYIKIIL